LYLLIQIAFIPLAVVGLLVGLYKEMLVSRRRGVSFSAGQSLQYRWFMHYFNTRPDQLSVRFVKKYPCESHFGLWAVMGALIISQRLFGFTTRMGRIPEPGKERLDSTAGARVLAFDRIVEKYIDEMDQLVLPGAGFDLIALRYTQNKNVRVFELDETNVMNIKIETLKSAGIEHDWIDYIPVEYSKESWVEKLAEAGFDKTRKTLFLWQSVSLFLDGETVRSSLREMADLCADGSVVAQDFYSRALVAGEMSAIARRNANLIGRMGEPWRFGIDMSRDPEEAITTLLGSCGLRMTEFRQFGEETDIEPFYCIVEAQKAARE